ncbi:M56 family metallopeptidase [Pontibacter sp. 172403-2]|uniref:M56 family metallopeptidase n=1 Tax=Pontibacter rufus TaxID=2791028 RepID=UPI0018AFAB3B|nr:M56 family metallopeptidase [Pontibacter sp. 172403-2]MBF9252819.1 M56 family metallopeptidase [Pontibacter sp. 172403-2]
METMLSFILTSGVLLLALYLFYFALLRTQTSFAFNRLYLLLAPVAALTIPLVEWPAILAPDTVVAQTLQAIQLSEVVVTAYAPETGLTGLPAILSFARLLLLVYLAGMIFILYRLATQLYTIRRLKTAATPVNSPDSNAEVYLLQTSLPAFAFGKAVFLNSQDQLSKAEQQQVLAHELAHVQFGHSYDIIYYELLTALLWFNPVVWLLKQELRDVHEFQADADVLRSCQLQSYTSLLSKEVLLNMGLPIGSYFQKPQVFRRLHMLQQHGHKAGFLRPLLILPLLTCIILFFGSRQVTGHVAATLSTDASTGSAIKDVQASITPPPATTIPNKQPTPELRQQTPTPEKSNLANMPVSKEKAEDAMPIVSDEPLPDGKPYTYVEMMPQFKGGEAEMLKFLGKNIRYPQEAQEASLEGLVVLSFVVEEDGSLHDIEILKKLGEGTDEEAIRVVKLMSGQWLPGMQNGTAVPVRYTLPVRFTIK